MDLRNWRALAAGLAILLAFILGGCDLLSSPTAPTSGPTSSTSAALGLPSSTPNAHPTTIARATVVAAVSNAPIIPSISSSAPTATAWAEGWTTFAGRYFTIQVAPFWKDMSDQPSPYWNDGTPSPYASTLVVEDTGWRIDGITGSYVQVQALYQPCSDLLREKGFTPFRAGNLLGATRTNTIFDTYSVEIVLPSTPDNRGAICFRASLELPASLPQREHDILAQQFKEAVAVLGPSQEAMQGTPTAIPAPPGVHACSAKDLGVSIDGQGCTGFFCGIITLSNNGKTTCSVGGRPVMKYISPDGKGLPVAQDPFTPKSGNAVMLKPRGSARMLFREAYDYTICSPAEMVPVTATWTMELSGIVGPIILGKPMMDSCKGDLPFVAYMEVGTFEAGK